MNKIGILYHPLNPSAISLGKNIQDSLRSRKLTSWLGSAWEEKEARENVKGTDLIISIGGDGTILRAAQAACDNAIPITGINSGNLGFMTELTADAVEPGLSEIIEGKGWIDERAMLEAALKKPGSITHTYHALNDVVMARGAVARLVNIDVEIDGKLFTGYRADGLILATGTGSTGYSLAAGGPILHPHSKNILLTPLLSHLSPEYSLVLPEDASVKLTFKSAIPGTLSIDGHINQVIENGTVLSIKKSKHVTRFLRISSKGIFYSTLEQRLKGKRK